MNDERKGGEEEEEEKKGGRKSDNDDNEILFSYRSFEFLYINTTSFNQFYIIIIIRCGVRGG